MSQQKHEKKQFKEKKEINIYKYITFILIGIIILSLVLFGLYKINQKTYINGIEFGQNNAVNIILNEVNSNGFILINTSENSSITLVNVDLIKIAQEEIILEIIEEIKTTGAVKLYNQDEEFILIEHIVQNFNENISSE